MFCWLFVVLIDYGVCVVFFFDRVFRFLCVDECLWVCEDR